MEQLSVLLIDDEKELLLAMAERLALRGFDVQAAVSGTDALALIEQNQFDVVVMDVRMPGIDGLELMNRLKQEHPALQMILCTGDETVKDSQTAIKQEATDCLIKPVDIDELAEKIRKACEDEEEA